MDHGASENGVGPQVDPVYTVADNMVQTGVDSTSLSGSFGKVNPHAATQSFDEPLEATAVLDIARLFIK